MMVTTAPTSPNWLRVGEIVDQAAMDEARSLLGELQAMEPVLSDSFRKVFRLWNDVEARARRAAEEVADVATSAEDTLLEALRAYSGVQALIDIGYRMGALINAGIGETVDGADVPWLREERERASVQPGVVAAAAAETAQEQRPAQHPSSLRAHIEAGGTLDGFDKNMLGWLAELVITNRRIFGLDELAQKRMATDDDDDDAFDELIRAGRAKGASEERIAEVVENRALSRLFFDWETELLADEALCERVEGLIPEEVAADYRDWTESELRPFRVLAADLPEYRCVVTGKARSGWAIVLEPTTPTVAKMVEVQVAVSPEVMREALAQVP